jgi:hypothetical protein
VSREDGACSRGAEMAAIGVRRSAGIGVGGVGVAMYGSVGADREEGRIGGATAVAGTAERS